MAYIFFIHSSVEMLKKIFLIELLVGDCVGETGDNVGVCVIVLEALVQLNTNFPLLDPSTHCQFLADVVDISLPNVHELSLYSTNTPPVAGLELHVHLNPP